MGPEAGLAVSELAAADIALGGLGGSAGAAALAPAGAGLGFGTALQLGSGVANLLAAEDAARRRKSISKAKQQYQTERARKGAAITDEFLAGETPEAREASRQAAEAEANAAYQTSIGAAGAADRATSGKVGERYTMGKVQAEGRAKDYGTKISGLLSKMRGVGQAGLDRSRKFSRAGGEVQAQTSAGRSVGGAYDTDIGNVQVNPYFTAATGAVGGYGSGLTALEAMRRSRAKPAYSSL